MKYRRAINRRLDDAASSTAGAEDYDPALVARCWPEPDREATLPRVVQRDGHSVLDEGWVVVDDDDGDEQRQDGD